MSRWAHYAGLTLLEIAVGEYNFMGASVAICLLGCGGIVATNWILHARFKRRPLKLSAEDLSVLMPTAWDGIRLHSEVPKERWCVTRNDLKQFRRLVQHAVQEGRITPTDLDGFDPNDAHVGPSIYTVCSQFIVPVTHHAGDVSWALMLHPEGLPCDLFVTHSWAEGIYEFVDKVVHSWPPGCRHAYCCMLSNPQSLDISGLIASPMDSPFAKALQQAKHLLVVPNFKGSIYTRVWCAYEAFLGYQWGKLISTASAPVLGFWPKVTRTVFIWLMGLGAGGLAVSARQRRSDLYRVFAYAACLVVCMLVPLAMCLRARARHGRALRFIIFAGCFDCGLVMAGAAAFYGTQGPASVVIMISIGPFMCAATEADRLWAVEAVAQAEQLISGFTGRLRDAECSVPADGDRIRAELVESGLEKAADEAVAVLIRTGMCSPHLHEAQMRAGALGNVSIWSMAYVLGGVLTWTVFPLFYLEKDVCTMHWPPRVAVLEAFFWVALFMYQPRDRRAFTVAAQLIVFSTFPLAVPAVFIRGRHAPVFACSSSLLTAYASGPVALVLSIAGPARVARVPVLGPALVRMLLGVRRRLQAKGEPRLSRGESQVREDVAAALTRDREVGPDTPVAFEPQVDEEDSEGVPGDLALRIAL